MNHRLFVTGLIALALTGLLLSRGSVARQAAPASYTDIKTMAEREYAAGSYARANALYLQAKSLDLNETDKRWVVFRLADTAWRSQAGTQTADSTIFDNARKDLEA